MRELHYFCHVGMPAMGIALLDASAPPLGPAATCAGPVPPDGLRFIGATPRLVVAVQTDAVQLGSRRQVEARCAFEPALTDDPAAWVWDKFGQPPPAADGGPPVDPFEWVWEKFRSSAITSRVAAPPGKSGAAHPALTGIGVAANLALLAGQPPALVAATLQAHQGVAFTANAPSRRARAAAALVGAACWFLRANLSLFGDTPAGRSTAEQFVRTACLLGVSPSPCRPVLAEPGARHCSCAL